MTNELKREIANLKQPDLYSMAFFCLYKLGNVPEYSSLSELPYVLDKNGMLNLCEYFGGQTIRIPTRSEFETVLSAILLYQYVNVEDIDYNDALELLGCTGNKLKKVKSTYRKICSVMDDYSPRGVGDEDE